MTKTATINITPEIKCCTPKTRTGTSAKKKKITKNNKKTSKSS